MLMDFTFDSSPGDLFSWPSVSVTCYVRIELLVYYGWNMFAQRFDL